MDIKTIGKIARNNFVTDIINSIGVQTDLAKVKTKSLEEWSIFKKMNLDAILLWENFLNLSVEPTWSLNDRRERIIYTLNSTRTFTEDFLKEQSKRFDNGDITITEEFEDFNFIINFISSIGVPTNLNNYIEMVETNKPAHLTYSYLIRFRSHKELEVKTHNELAQFTHDQLRQGGIL